jgi:hypothetical protein
LTVWVRLDDRFYDHPKILALSDGALAFYVRALSYCGRNETDGLLSRNALRALCPDARKRGRNARKLVAAGLLDRGQDGALLVHDWHDYNPSHAELQERRDAAAERSRRFRAKRGVESSNGVTRRVARRVTPVRSNALPDPIDKRYARARDQNDANARPPDPPRPHIPLFEATDLEPTEPERNFGREHAQAMLKRLRGLDREPDDDEPETF